MKARSGDVAGQQANGTDSMEQIHDLSILRKPIQTTITGFTEVVKAYENGTEEIRKLMANECDIIYECKACRNIFRSLGNFISHKRIYCRIAFNSANHFHFQHDGCIDQDISTIIHLDEQSGNNRKSTAANGGGGGGGSGPKTQDKDLGSIIERLLRREQNNQNMNLNDYYAQAQDKLTVENVLDDKKNDDKLKSDEYILQLDNVNDSNVAVFQTIKSADTESIKNEVNEVHSLMQKYDNVMGPDGKILTGTLQSSLLTKNINHSCKLCSATFSTEKTLKLHIKAKHIPSTYVYPCPSCSQTFMQPAAVIRHLSNDHKKSMRRIRLMRDAICKRRTRIDEVPIKGPNRELARLQTDKERAEQLISSSANRNWLDSTSEIKEALCKHCGKSFERRAALITHLKNCSLKNKSDAANDTNNKKATATTSSSANNNNNNSEESSEDSLDEFLRMLNHEKKIQATVENSIAEEESSNFAVELAATTNNDVELETTKVRPKNKRKQNRTRKMDSMISSESVTDDKNPSNDIDWNMDNDEDLLPIKIKVEPSDSPPEMSSTSLNDSQPIKTEKSTIEKKTNCTICQRKFANIGNLRRHVAMYHYRQKKYGCKLCDNQAFRKFDIVNHLFANHGINNENDEALKLVVLLNIDKNKFNEEKALAVANALGKLNEKDRIENGSDESITDEVVMLNVKEELIMLDTSNENSSTNYDDPPLAVRRRGRPPLKNKTKSPTSLTNGNHSHQLSKSKAKLSRNSSSNSLPDELYVSRRPVRNRVKAVNKDFVYDLSNLLKKDSDYGSATTTKGQKRKSAQTLTATLNETIKDQESTSIPITSTPTIPPIANKRTAFSDIKGAAMDMAKQAVLNFRACFSQPPEIPSERPIVPSKIIQYRVAADSNVQDFRQLQQELGITQQDGTIQSLVDRLEMTHIKKRRLSKKSSTESIPNADNLSMWKSKETLPKHNPFVGLVATDEPKVDAPIVEEVAEPSIDEVKATAPIEEGIDEVAKTTVNEIASSPVEEPEVDLATDEVAAAAAAEVEPAQLTSDNKIIIKCPTEDEFNQYLQANNIIDASVSAPISRRSSFQYQDLDETCCSDSNINTSSGSTMITATARASSVPSTNPKQRVTLMQRLNENKHRKLQESLLKINFYENGSQDKNQLN